MRRRAVNPWSAGYASVHAQFARARAFTWLLPGTLGLLTIPLYPGSASRPGLAAVSLLITLYGLVLLRVQFTALRAYCSTFAAAVMIGFAAFYAGPDLGPSVAVIYIPTATYAFFQFRRPWAFSIVGAIAVSYAVVLVAGGDGGIGVVRWALVVSMSLSAGSTEALVFALTQRSTQAAAEAREQARSARSELELERLRRLKGFVPPRLADLVANEETGLLRPHRAEVGVLFVDLRGFTELSTTAEPEDVTAVLEEYHRAVGGLVDEHDAAIGDFAGDGVMAYVNDPIPCAEPARTTVELGLAIQRAMDELSLTWQRRGYAISYGIGISLGYATVGIIGTHGRRDYKPVGRVVNLAARLSDEAPPGAILLDHRTYARMDGLPVRTEAFGARVLKGFGTPVQAYAISA